MAKTEFKFPVGYHEFHKDQLFNFQLNRWYSWGYASFEDMEEVGPRINNVEDWKNEMKYWLRHRTRVGEAERS